MLTDLQTSGGAVIGEHHEVLHFLIVDLDNGKADLEGLSRALQLADSGEDLIAGDGHYTLVGSISDLIR